MKVKSGWLAVATVVVAFATAALNAPIYQQVRSAASDSLAQGRPDYDSQGHLRMPIDYREWVFLSSGFDMSYNQLASVPNSHLFSNVFAPRAAYESFKRTGIWPDKTILILEIRGGSGRGSITAAGQFQTGQVVALEAHVKDIDRFEGGWGFFSFDNGAAAERIAYDADCYACHQANAAVDTTFVQFYPTLLPIAARLETLSPAYLASSDQVAH